MIHNWFKVHDSWFMIHGSRFMVQDSWFRVHGYSKLKMENGKWKMGPVEKEDWMLCEPNEKEGRFLLSEIMAGGNFGKSRQDEKVRNSFSRWMMMLKHYPSEVLWMVPWKVWHKGWRLVN